MSTTKFAILGALALATLALTAGDADAQVYDWTNKWCKTRPAADQTIVASESAILVWQPDGELVLEPINGVASYIWKAGTANSGVKLCMEAGGALTIYNAAGVEIWGQDPMAVSQMPSNTTIYWVSLALDGCSLQGQYKAWDEFDSKTYTGGVGWNRPGTCPTSLTSAVSNTADGEVGWCMDTDEAGVLLENEWAYLYWQSDGNLVLYANGVDQGTVIWASGTHFLGEKLCLQANGRLEIYSANDDLVFYAGGTGSTLTNYMFGLDGCNLSTKALDASSTLLSIANTCPQATMPKNTGFTRGTSEQILAENDDAKLVFDTTGNLVLKSTDGDVFWTSNLASGVGNAAVLDNAGNLLIYSTTGLVFSSGGTSGTQLVMNRCSFSLKTSSGSAYYTRGSTTCAKTSVMNTAYGLNWMSNSGTTRLLQRDDSYLDWQSDGNLVLYTASGTPIWSTGTAGTGRNLAFQGDGNLVVYKASGSPWGAGSNDNVSDTLKLGENCLLEIYDGATWKKTLNSSCSVANYTFESNEGNKTLGMTMTTNINARTVSNVPRTDSVTTLQVTIFGNPWRIFQATAYQYKNGNTTITGPQLTIGTTLMAQGTVGKDYEFFKKEKPVMIGCVPVVVTAAAVGSFSLSFGVTSDTLGVSLTPDVGVYAVVTAEPATSAGAAGATAGIRGTLTIINISLPITFSMSFTGGNKYDIQGDLEISTLSGSLAAYAKAYVKALGLEYSVEASYTFLKWKGVEWSRTLFDKSGTF